MATDATSTLVAELVDDVLWLTLNRPERLNAMDAATRQALIEALDTAGDSGARCVVVRGNGRGFCSGADLKDIDPRRGIYVYERMRASTQRLVQSVRNCPVPVIASVHGACAGAGLSFALAADVCIVADDARLIASFTLRSVVPDGGIAWLLPRLVGLAHAKRWLMLGEEISGAEAAAMGAVAASVPLADLGASTLAMAGRVSRLPTKALSYTKSLINETAASDFAAFLLHERTGAAMVSQTRDAAEGIAAFREHRDPQYSNE